MRIIIAGSRNYTNYEEAKTKIQFILSQYQSETPFVFLSGNCNGADRLGERFAKENGYPLELYPAEWKRYGAAAGPIRNKKMVDLCDAVICFWDGKSKGTAGLIQYAKKANKHIFIQTISSI